nr:uncharacterized protein LOC104112593 [Nicotiana tomentosiformis]
MVRSRGRGDTSKGRGEPSKGRGKSTLSLALQKIITKKATVGRGRNAEPSESSSYAPSSKASEGNSVQEQPTIQSKPPERYQLRDEPSTSHSTSEGSESASQASEPSSTPVPEVPATIVDDISDNSRREDTTVVGLERSKKKEIWEDRFISWVLSLAFVGGGR